MKSFINFPGPKYLDYIIPFIPKTFNRYLEPYIGNESLFLHIKPKNWIINTDNKSLYNAWYYVWRQPQDIIKYINQSKTYLLNNPSIVQQIKYVRSLAKQNNCSHIEKTTNYILLNNLHIRKFQFNWFAYETNIYCLSRKYQDNLLAISHFMNTTNGLLYNKSYKTVLDFAKYGDFVLLDPPIQEYKDLLDLHLNSVYLDKQCINWMIIQSDTSEIRFLFKNFYIYPIPKTDKLIIMNYHMP